MIFACLFIAAAVGTQTPIHTEVKIHYVRPTKVVEFIERGTLFSLDAARIEADDVKSVVIVDGTPQKVDEIKQLINLFDIQRRKLSISVTVDSEVDKVSYQASAKVMNLQQWKTSDGDSGITVAVEPRINDDGTVTMMATIEQPGNQAVTVVFREKSGASRTITINNPLTAKSAQRPSGSIATKSTAPPAPTVTIRADLP